MRSCWQEDVPGGEMTEGLGVRRIQEGLYCMRHKVKGDPVMISSVILTERTVTGISLRQGRCP